MPLGRWWRVSARVFVIVYLLGLALLPSVGLAQNVVESTSPATRDPSVASPGSVAITFTGALDPTAPSSLVVMDEAGHLTELSTPAVANDTLSAMVTSPLPRGSYVSLWSAQIAAETSPRIGSFGFQVGADAGVPGEALAPGSWPAPGAVLARALVIIGLGVALAGALAGLPGGRLALGPLPLVCAGIGAAGAVWLTSFAALDIAGPAVPTAGWAMLAGSSIVLACEAGRKLALASPAVGRGLSAVGLAAAVTALVSLGLWTASGAAEAAAILTIAGLAALPLLVGLLVAGGMLLGAWSITTANSPRPGQLVWSATLAAGALALMLTGLLAAPELLSLGAGSFGLAAIATGITLLASIVICVLLRRQRIGGQVVAALAAIGALPVAVLGLTVPAGLTLNIARMESVDIVAPYPAANGGESLVHLVVVPSAPGPNGIAAFFTSIDGAPLAPPTSTLPATLTSLNLPAEDSILNLTAVPSTPFLVGAMDLSHKGWWQASIAGPDGSNQRADITLLAPDPNIHGRGPESTTDPAAAALFASSLDRLTSLNNVRLEVDLGSGFGTHGETSLELNAGSDGSVPSARETSAQIETITIGNTQWFQMYDGAWQQRPTGRINTPASWRETYDHATGFTLGPVVPSFEGDGEELQVLSFWIPRQTSPQQEAAWYVWWIGTESGQVHREAMISTQHYMVYHYSDFNQPISIAPPVTAPPTPSSSPVATPLAP